MSNALQTEMEFTLVKQYILLPLLMNTLEHDIKFMEMSPLKMATVYVTQLKQVQKDVHEDLVRVRKQMRAHGLKVYDEKKTRLGTEVQYTCRGYHHPFSMLWSLVRSEIEVLLSGYLGVDLDT